MDPDRVKQAIESAIPKRTIGQVAASLEVSREHLNRLLTRKEKFPEKYLTKLRTIGINVPTEPGVIKSDAKGEEEKGASFYERMIKYLQDTWEEAKETQKENITDLRENNRGILKTNQELTDSHKTYRKMVEMCIEMGIIVPNVQKAKN
jgi:hypothetical protein